MRKTFVQSPRKSTRRASRETGIPNVIVWRVLRKRLHLKAYKLSVVQHLKDTDKVLRKEFCMQMFHRIQDDERFLDSVMRTCFMSVVRSIPTTARSARAKMHVSPWNLFVTAQS
jgi:hypothetical protein